MKPNVQKKRIIPQTPVKLKKGTNKQKRTPLTPLELNNGEVVDPLRKIKLQLFPVDEITRIGLEKDGLNPFLELTLRARKKISSVIQHIQTKWGGSSIAIGEPMLLPYNAQRKWTLKDTFITAGDVYTAVGSPAVFRLSYGWFSEHEHQRVSTATAPQNCIKSEITEKQIETTEERKCVDATDEVSISITEHVDTKAKIGQSQERSTPPQDDEMTNLRIGGLLSELSNIPNNDLHPISLCTDISIGGLFSEASLQGKFNNNDLILNSKNTSHQQPIIQWDDMTALSIGGLLSEASLQAKINKSDKKSNEKEFISDSFDAIISSQKTNPQSHSSILDAEETCNAFSFRKITSSSKNVRVSARASQDLTSNSFRFPDLLEVEKQDEIATFSEPKTEMFPRPQQYGEDSRSIGLRGLTWNESLGPFDLGNSMPYMDPLLFFNKQKAS